METVFTLWKKRFIRTHTTSFPAGFLTLPQHAIPFPTLSQWQRNCYCCFFSFSDIKVTVHIPKSNTTHFESGGQSSLTIGYGVVKFNNLYKYTDH